MKKLILMVGLPRSGKTTKARELSRELNAPIVNRDSIRLALHGLPYVQEAEEMVTAIETIMVKSLFGAGHETVIVDATHVTEKRRKRWESDEWEITLCVMRVSKEKCIERALRTGDMEIIPVIERMARNWDVEYFERAIFKGAGLGDGFLWGTDSCFEDANFS